MNAELSIDPEMKALHASPCPCCGWYARATSIHFIMVDCPNMECRGPRWDILEPFEITLTLDTALDQWERVVALTHAVGTGDDPPGR